MALSFKSLLTSIQSQTFEQAQRVVGIDIGSASIKVVELDHTDKGPILCTYGELQLGPYAGNDLGAPTELDPKQQLAALVDVLREAGVAAEKGVLAVPLSSSFVTVAPFRATAKEQLDARIPVEARKYIPVPLAEVTLDWIEVPAASSEKNIREVLLVALQNEAMSATNVLLSQVSMAGQPTELEIFSAIRATAESDSSLYSIIDIGAQYSRLYIVRDGILVRVHRVATGGSAITRQIMTESGKSFAESEEIKRNANGSPEVLAVTELVLRPGISEFARAMSAYEQESGLAIEKVILSGGVASTLGLASSVQAVINRPTVIANPFSKVGFPAFMEDVLTDIGPAFTGSVGAALRLIYS